MRDKDIDFVARHYRRGAFSSRQAWHRMHLWRSGSLRQLRVAAAIAMFVAITATAAILIRNEYFANDSHSGYSDSPTEAVASEYVERTIDFDDVPLPVVLNRISEVYGVEIENLPADAASYHLTLHYEGNAIELVETINDILDTEMAIKE